MKAHVKVVSTAQTLPLRTPQRIAGTTAGGRLVEAPGTAPGSATLISQAVYRHSRLPDNGDIGRQATRDNPAACRLRAREKRDAADAGAAGRYREPARRGLA